MDCLKQDEPQARFGRAVFDAVPLAAFMVDGDVRILEFNAAAEAFLGFAPRASLRRRGGEVFHCVHAGPNGCGKSKACQNCLIRTSVKAAINGKDIRRKFGQVELRGSRGAVPVSLLVTASLLPDTQTPQVLLILENVAETVRLCKRHAGA